MPTVYFDVGWEMDNEKWLRDIEQLTPESSRRWGTIEAITDPEAADYHAVFNQPSVTDDPDRRLLFCMEPPCLPNCSGWDRLDALAKYPLSRYHKPQNWWIDRSYDELVAMEPPEKTEDLSWITTDKGRDVDGPVGTLRRLMLAAGYRRHASKRLPLIPDQPTDGHILRMDFLKNLEAEHPEVFDLYGRGGFSGPHYRGPIEDKWTGLADYRYSLAVENYRGPNYFSEKITDALLAWSMPIYWGCTNLGDYLPEDSYLWLDIEDPDAPQQLRKIIEQNPWEDRLDAIAEARRRILDEFQVWPTVERAVNEVV